MFKMIKLVITLAGLAALAYFVFFVPLGKKTFYEHLARISETPEARDLGFELQKKVELTETSIKRQLHGIEDPQPKEKNEGKTQAGAGGEIDKGALSKLIQARGAEISEEDKEELEKLLEGLHPDE